MAERFRSREVEQSIGIGWIDQHKHRKQSFADIFVQRSEIFWILIDAELMLSPDPLFDNKLENFRTLYDYIIEAERMRCWLFGCECLSDLGRGSGFSDPGSSQTITRRSREARASDACTGTGS